MIGSGWAKLAVVARASSVLSGAWIQGLHFNSQTSHRAWLQKRCASRSAKDDGNYQGRDLVVQSCRAPQLANENITCSHFVTST
ncbi:hypothetical protein V8C26DRAFT_392036 [Trichoderma gracile]